MAIPHGKKLVGREAGGKSIHWYNFIQSKRQILKSGKWNGPRTRTKPGVKVMIWLGFDKETAKACWGSTC